MSDEIENSTPIRPRERDAIIQALRAGVVPRVGQQHIQVGRHNEVKALVSDISTISEGGSAFRIVVGEYGSGKTFFLNLIKAVALKEKLVTIHADLSPDRRIYSTSGQARALYVELVGNMATLAKPEGGAMSSILERFITSAITQGKEEGISTEEVITARLQILSEQVGGYDFAQVVLSYWRGYNEGNHTLQENAIRWMRGEYTTKTDARAALGVRTFVDDENFYDQLKLLSSFVVMAGFNGLLVCLDEMVNLYKLAFPQSRSLNYEQLLRILNDSLQGTASHLGFILGGTLDFLKDTRRGLYSYAALQSRLAENSYAIGGLVDYSGPVLNLSSLSQEDMFILLKKLRNVYAGGDESKYLIPDEALQAFMIHCSNKVGDAYFRTPRTTIKEFVNLLAVLDQNPNADWNILLNNVSLKPEANPDLAIPFDTGMIETGVEGIAPQEKERGDDDKLSDFRL